MTKSRGLRKPKGTRQVWLAANQGAHVCQCGCGEAIPLRAEHFNVGVPKYRHGHNPRPVKAKPPRQLCECGCGEMTNYGKRYISGHNSLGHTLSVEGRQKISVAMTGDRNHRAGKHPHNYKGRIIVGGYVMVQSPDHPYRGTKNGLVMEHRLVLEDHLRTTDPANPHLIAVDGVLYLRRESQVHHINEKKDDNRVENLAAMTAAEHSRHHETWKIATAKRIGSRRV